MLTALALKAWGLIRATPWQVWLVLAVLLTGWLWGNHRYSQGYDKRTAEYAAAAAQAVTDARKADAAAQNTVDAGKELSGAEIGRGRNAAVGSDDPWQSATDAMRNKQ